MRNRSILLALMMLSLLATPALLRAQKHADTQSAHKSEATAARTETAADVVEAEHEAKSPLVPSITDAEAWYQALWVFIWFVILLAILYPLAWKPMLLGLKKREEGIRGNIADAEAQRVKAESTLKAYNDQLAGAEARIREMLTKAQADGEKLATNIRMQAQQEAEEAKERAQRDIESSKNAAIREVYEQTASISTSIAEKILRRNLNADDQRELVRQSLEQLQTMK